MKRRAVLRSGIAAAAIAAMPAIAVDRILKGANPAEMPIEQPSFEVVVNLKIAREIGVSIPQSILLRAERVIQ